MCDATDYGTELAEPGVISHEDYSFVDYIVVSPDSPQVQGTTVSVSCYGADTFILFAPDDSYYNSNVCPGTFNISSPSGLYHIVSCDSSVPDNDCNNSLETFIDFRDYGGMVGYVSDVEFSYTAAFTSGCASDECDTINLLLSSWIPQMILLLNRCATFRVSILCSPLANLLPTPLLSCPNDLLGLS